MTAARPIRVTVNGVVHEAQVEPRTTLADFLRGQLALTGTHLGCDTAVIKPQTYMNRSGRVVAPLATEGIDLQADLLVVVDDFAHHPTAVRAAIGGLRARYPGRRLVAVFEPRTNTSRRAIFQRDYATAFDAADALVVSIVPDEPIYSAIGAVDERDRFDATRLVRELQNNHKRAIAMQDIGEIVGFLVEESEPGDVILVMSNGGFDGIWEKLLEGLRS